MLNNNDVYLHRRADTGEVFYVGIGVSGRAKSRSGRTDHWKNIVAKHGLHIEYVERGVSRERAIDAETSLIALIGRVHDGSGPLINITDGGEGCPGRDKGKKLSLEHRAKLAAAKIGVKQSPETVAKRTSKVKGQKRTEAQRKVFSEIAKNRSEEHFKKISDALRGKPISESHRKAIQKARNVEIKIVGGQNFGSITDAVLWLRSQGIDKASHSNITACCRGRKRSAYGHRWAYADPHQK